MEAWEIVLIWAVLLWVVSVWLVLYYIWQAIREEQVHRRASANIFNTRLDRIERANDWIIQKLDDEGKASFMGGPIE